MIKEVIKNEGDQIRYKISLLLKFFAYFIYLCRFLFKKILYLYLINFINIFDSK